MIIENFKETDRVSEVEKRKKEEELRYVMEKRFEKAKDFEIAEKEAIQDSDKIRPDAKITTSRPSSLSFMEDRIASAKNISDYTDEELEARLKEVRDKINSK